MLLTCRLCSLSPPSPRHCAALAGRASRDDNSVCPSLPIIAHHCRSSKPNRTGARFQLQAQCAPSSRCIPTPPGARGHLASTACVPPLKARPHHWYLLWTPYGKTAPRASPAYVRPPRLAYGCRSCCLRKAHGRGHAKQLIPIARHHDHTIGQHLPEGVVIMTG